MVLVFVGKLFCVRVRLVAILLVIGLVQACSTSRVKPSGGRPAPPSRFGILAPDKQARVDANCFDGMPVDTWEPNGATELVVRGGYVLEHSSVDKIPLWVCESVSAAQLRGHLVRSNRFKADPQLLGAKAYPQDYVRSGFDRGHQAPAGNQNVDPVLKDETFYMSNMAPQRPSLNRGIWKELEDLTRTWVLRYGHAYEWTGPVRCEPEKPLVPVILSGCVRRTIGVDAVAVPVFFYKIVVVEDKLGWKAIAFLLPNVDFKRPYKLAAYITSIKLIEQATGIEFMPKMDAKVRRGLVERAEDISAW